MNGQIYFNGLSYLAYDVLRTQEGVGHVSVFTVSELIYRELMIARRVLGQAKYNGQLSVYATLRGGKGAHTHPPIENRIWHDDHGVLRYAEYKWAVESDTTALADDIQLAKLHTNLVKQISWDIGLGEVSDRIITDYFTSRRWYKLPDQTAIET